MASGGKKNKKTKGKTIALTEFLGDALPPPPRPKTLWSDSVDDDPPIPSVQMFLPTAPRAARGNEVDESRIPKSGPYMAYISNLPYEIDDTDIYDFFGDFTVSNLRLPRDERNNKIRGFGYVEFPDKASLVGALQIVDTTIKGRPIRIEIADSSNEGGYRRGGGMRDRDRDYDSGRSSTDWRASRSENFSNDDRRGGSRWEHGGGGFRDNDRDRDRDRGDMDTSSNWREGRRPIEDRPRDSWESRTSSSYGGGPRRNFGGDRDRDRDRERESSPPGERVRPKLNLKTLQDLNLTDDKPALPPPEPKVEEAPRPPKPSAASIFGGAKPVDTSAREREIEERLAKDRVAPADPSRSVSKSEPPRDRGLARRGDRDAPSSESAARREDTDAPPSESAARDAPPPENAWARRSQPPRSREDPDKRRDDDDERRSRTEDEKDRGSSRHDDDNKSDRARRDNGEERPRASRDPSRDRNISGDRSREGRSSSRDQDRGNSSDRGRDRGRSDDRDRNSVRNEDRDRDGVRNEDRDKDVGRDRYQPPSRDRARDYSDKGYSRDRGYSRNEDRDRGYNRDRDYGRRDRDSYGNRDRGSYRDSDRNRGRDGDRYDRERDRPRNDDRARDAERDRPRTDDRGRDAERDRPRNEDRGRDVERDGGRDSDRDDRDRNRDDRRRPHSRDGEDKDRAQRSTGGRSGTRTADPKDKDSRPPKEIPKVKESVTPNYVAENKYSFLDPDAASE